MFGQKNSKAYLEITNVCNLSCSFCHGTTRPPRFMSIGEFRIAASRLRPFCEYLYLHLMGETLLHPQLRDILACAADLGFKVILTTNGTLLAERSDVLLNSDALFKVSISLHSFENMNSAAFDNYLKACTDFCNSASDKGIICVYRLWNISDDSSPEAVNSAALDSLHALYPNEWKKIYSGYRLSERKVFLEWGKRFDWPDADPEKSACNDSEHFCYGLSDQIGVLCDGSIVPCCLDADGAVTLGNIFTDDLQDVLNSERASSLLDSFAKRCVTEPLCRHCGYAARYK